MNINRLCSRIPVANVLRGKATAKRHRLLAILMLLAAAMPIGCGQSEETSTLARIQERGSMRIGTDATYAPFEFVSERTGLPAGYDIDLMDSICAHLGVKAEYIVSPFDGIIAGLTTDKYDCIISAMTITPDRAEKVLFSRPYYAAGQSIAVREDNDEIKSLADLNGRKVGVQMGTTGMRFAESLGGVEVFPYDHIGAAFIDLQNGRVDAVINDRPVTQIAIKERGGIKIVGDVLSDERYGIAVRKSDSLLVEQVDIILTELEEAGYFESLQVKWF